MNKGSEAGTGTGTGIGIGIQTSVDATRNSETTQVMGLKSAISSNNSSLVENTVNGGSKAGQGTGTESSPGLPLEAKATEAPATTTTGRPDDFKQESRMDSFVIEDDDGSTTHEVSVDANGNIKDVEKAGQTNSGSPSDATPPPPPPPPDGGLQAWVVVAAAFFLQFAAIGLRDSIGVYQRFFVINQTFPGSSSLAVSFIGSIAAAVWGAVGPITGFCIAKFGFHATAFAGGFIFLVAYTCASFSTALWQLYLSQGVMVGIAFAAC